MQAILENTESNPYTEDSLLGGKIIIRQPTQGYRVAIDPILLSAAISVEVGESVLDVGAGVGAAALCLSVRFPYCRIMGIERQKDLVRLATDNIRLNNLRERVEILLGDLQSPPPRLAAGSYSQVISNPPYFESNRGRLSVIPSKALSNHEELSDMESWLKFCLLMLKPMGKLTFIYRADMLDRLLSLFYGKVGDVSIFPLWPAHKKSAKRVIVQGIKGTKGGVNLLSGMCLHNEDGSFTPAAEAVLRHGEPLILDI